MISSNIEIDALSKKIDEVRCKSVGRPIRRPDWCQIIGLQGESISSQRRIELFVFDRIRRNEPCGEVGGNNSQLLGIGRQYGLAGRNSAPTLEGAESDEHAIELVALIRYVVPSIRRGPDELECRVARPAAALERRRKKGQRAIRKRHDSDPGNSHSNWLAHPLAQA
jgi:hypothetical protein